MQAAQGAEETTDWRAVGQQIESLLDAASAGGQVARERAENLVRLLSDLYGAGMQRMLEVLDDAGRLDDELEKRFAADDLLSGLLLVHGLHPQDAPTRVVAALDEVRPYLGSHGGDVEFLGLTDDGVVRLRLLGSCDGCPSSAVTLELAVKEAVLAAAPEVTSIEVEAPHHEAKAGTGQSGSGQAGVISIESLRSRLGESPAADVRWLPAAELSELSDGEVGGFVVDDRSILACRLGDDLYAYADECGACHEDLAGAAVQRQVGSSRATAVLTCPHCRAHFDVRGAGAGIGSDAHLRPIPLVGRDGVPTLAMEMAARR